MSDEEELSWTAAVASAGDAVSDGGMGTSRAAQSKQRLPRANLAN